jgi:ABC-2 type transport system ATP-binding protein
MDSVIQLKNVFKQFGEQMALADVSLDVPPGVVFALLGENGAGKTTAIKLLLGLEEATSGRASVLGLDSRHHGLEIRRRVGYVPERPTLYEWMTVAEIGWFAAGFYDAAYLPRYEALVAQYELPLKRKIKDLSKGMRAKVALSLALAHEPEVLILDEPTSGLDTLVRREFLESMVDLAAAGRTVLLSSHQIAEVERVADFVAILSHGKLLLVEQLDTLKQQVRELTVTLADGAAAPPVVCGELLRRRHRARQCQLLVRYLAEEHIETLRSHGGVASVESRTPALEEIFVAYLQSPPGVNGASVDPRCGQSRRALRRRRREDVRPSLWLRRCRGFAAPVQWRDQRARQDETESPGSTPVVKRSRSTPGPDNPGCRRTYSSSSCISRRMLSR